MFGIQDMFSEVTFRGFMTGVNGQSQRRSAVYSCHDGCLSQPALLIVLDDA